VIGGSALQLFFVVLYPTELPRAIGDLQLRRNARQKSKARNVAHIRDTGHFFRCVFAEKFLRDRDSRIL
jgi:hypothetical protein